jgi:hypothetical protein
MARLKRLAKIARRGPHIARDSVYDLLRYIRYSTAIETTNDARQLRGGIVRLTHNIEKGLSFPDPRPLFGFPHMRNLMAFTRRYIAIHGEDEVSDMARGVATAYLEFNAAAGAHDPFLDEVAAFAAKGRDVAPGFSGVLTRQESADRPSPESLTAFIRSRSSVRNYRPDPVPEEVLGEAARCAARAPSVCNRQFGRVWYTTDRAKIDAMLDVQGGARGFGHRVPTLLMVTAELSAYIGDERYQGWIDGGLFAMNLLLGLEAHGVSSCCLNWSKSRDTDRAMRMITDRKSVV